MTHDPQDAQHASLFEAIGGEPTFEKLVKGFYDQVPNDDIMGPMYPAEDLTGAHNRLKWFLMQYWGGPTDYQINRGHPRLRMRHFEFDIDQAAAERWLQLMENSLAQIDDETIPPAHRGALRDHFTRVASMLINVNPATTN